MKKGDSKMKMQTIHLDISSDIYDKVMSFLEILPKNKIRVKTDEPVPEPKKEKESLGNFFQSSPLVGLTIERNQEVYSSDRIEF
jgi:hypothetical protein